VRSRLDPNIRTNLQKLSGSRPTKDPSPLGSMFMQDRDGRPPTPPVPAGGLPSPTPMAEKSLNIPSLAWYKTLKITIDLTNQSEGCFEGKVCSANTKASSVMTQLTNLMVITYANQQRGCIVGNNRLMEMIAAIEMKIVAFQPPCIPTDWQANQIAYKKMASPHTVYLLADDLFDLGNLHEADEQPMSQENAKLAQRLQVRSFLHLWEKSGILYGTNKFNDYRVLTYLALDRAATEITKRYEMELKAVGHLGENPAHRCNRADRFRIES